MSDPIECEDFICQKIDVDWQQVYIALAPLVYEAGAFLHCSRPELAMKSIEEARLMLQIAASTKYQLIPNQAATSPPEKTSPASNLPNQVYWHHFTDYLGNPDGGITFGRGFTIAWQKGPLGRGKERKQPNGAFVEDIIGAAVNRLLHYQESRFACQENAAAIEHLQSALACLQKRTADREVRGVEGTHRE